MNRTWRIGLGLLAATALYIGVFSFWWLRSPVRLGTHRNGQTIRIVEFRFNAFSWNTRLLWQPAFWWIEHVCGYEPTAFAAAHKDSIQSYERPTAGTGVHPPR